MFASEWPKSIADSISGETFLATKGHGILQIPTTSSSAEKDGEPWQSDQLILAGTKLSARSSQSAPKPAYRGIFFMHESE
jgi:hypothetical protein